MLYMGNVGHMPVSASQPYQVSGLFIFMGKNLCFGHPAQVKPSTSAFSSLFLYVASCLSVWAAGSSGTRYIH